MSHSPPAKKRPTLLDYFQPISSNNNKVLSSSNVNHRPGNELSPPASCSFADLTPLSCITSTPMTAVTKNKISSAAIDTSSNTICQAPKSAISFDGNGRARKLYGRHINQYLWENYSTLLQGVLCSYFAMFSDDINGKAKQQHIRLVDIALKKYKDICVDLKNHDETKYHRLNSSRVHEFLNRTGEKQSHSIDRLVDKRTHEILCKNRRVLTSIIH